MSHQNTRATGFPARPSGLRSNPKTIWRGYSRTPGIEQFRQPEQAATWLYAHRQLVREDNAYAQANTRFHIQMVAVWIFALAMFYIISGINSIGLSLTLAIAGGAALAVFVFRAEQHRRNCGVGVVLSGKAVPRATPTSRCDPAVSINRK